MKTYKEHRLSQNPQEKVFHDKFIEMFGHDDGTANHILSAVVFGWKDDAQTQPKEYLSDAEENACLSIIQWLGSPVGQGFLDSCGFVPKAENEN